MAELRDRAQPAHSLAEDALRTRRSRSATDVSTRGRKEGLHRGDWNLDERHLRVDLREWPERSWPLQRRSALG